jgi:DNA-binding CsgD family transcriptional regulator
VRALHLLLIVQVAVTYAVTLLVLIVVGFALVWTWFGPALLLLALYLSRWAGDVEAWLVRRVARVELRRPPTAIERDQPFRSQVRQRLSDPTTWTGLVYLFAQVPFGVLAFLVVVVMPAVGVAFVVGPLFISAETPLDFGSRWTITEPRDAWWLPLAGAALLLGALHFVNVVSAAHAGWARLMLGSRAPHIMPGDPKHLGSLDEPESPRDGGGGPRPAPRSPASPGAQPAPVRMSDEADVLALASLATLTPRELDVLRLIARGYANAEIAEAFVISEGTVKTHVKRVLAKLSLRDRTQAAIFAYEHSVVRQAADEARAHA